MYAERAAVAKICFDRFRTVVRVHHDVCNAVAREQPHVMFQEASRLRPASVWAHAPLTGEAAVLRRQPGLRHA